MMRFAFDTITEEKMKLLRQQIKDMLAGARKFSQRTYRSVSAPDRSIDILQAHESPRTGLQTFASLGLVHSNWEQENFPDRIELVSCVSADTVDADRILMVVAETILSRQKIPQPGVIYLDAVKIADIAELSERMPHAMILFPHSWPQAFDKAEVSGHQVWFLQVVPLFENERQFIEEHGFAVFEELIKAYGARFEDSHRLPYLDL